MPARRKPARATPALGWQLLAFLLLALLAPLLWAFRIGDVPHKYTCRLARRIDAVIWRLRGKPVSWLTSDGLLGLFVLVRYDSGTAGGYEASTHFPDWFFVLACDVANRWPRARWLIDA
jgi:hypothetical protein